MEDRHLFLDVYRLIELTGAIVERQLREVGLPAYLFGLFSEIRRRAPVTPSQISQSTGIAMTTLRDNVQRLVDRGLITRIPNPDDGRSYLVEVTEKGEVLARAADPALLAAYEVLERRLQRPRVEYEQALDELREALAATLGELDGPAGGAHAARGKRAARGST